MKPIQFHARSANGKKEFICDQCSGQAVKKPGIQLSDQLPYVMFCENCQSVVGEWPYEKDRETFLHDLPTL